MSTVNDPSTAPCPSCGVGELVWFADDKSPDPQPQRGDWGYQCGGCKAFVSIPYTGGRIISV